MRREHQEGRRRKKKEKKKEKKNVFIRPLVWLLKALFFFSKNGEKDSFIPY